MTKIMAVTIVPILAFFMFVSTNEGPGQDAKSPVQSANEVLKGLTDPSLTEVQERRDQIINQASRDEERQLIKYKQRRAEARAEAKAERQAARQAERQADRRAKAQAQTEAESQSSPPAPSVDNSLDWAELRECESGGNYATNSGNGYYGAYQFSLSTWQGVGGSGYPHQASPSEQDMRAQILLSRSGDEQWPVCGDLLY